MKKKKLKGIMGNYSCFDPKEIKPKSVKRTELESFVKKMYKAVGKIDWSRNHLELFKPDVMHDLWMIFKSDLSNHQKANALDMLLEPMGFFELGLGTNVCTFGHDDYTGVVFKIALDRGGLCDNKNDLRLPKYAPEARPPITVDITNDAIVSVQEYVFPINRAEDILIYWKDALEICRKLSERFLVIDVTPKMYANWAIGRDMELRTCDISDLFPLPEDGTDLFRCPEIVGETSKKHKLIRCGGKVYYDDNYQWCYCSKCSRRILPAELRPKMHVWEDTEYLGVGYSDAQWMYANRRADRFAYYKAEAERVGLVPKFDLTPLCTPLPDTFPVRPMTDKEIAKASKKYGIKIPKSNRTEFIVDWPKDLQDFQDSFYKKYGMIPERLDKGTRCNLEKLIQIKPKLLKQVSKIMIGDDVIDLMEKYGYLLDGYKEEPVEEVVEKPVETVEVSDEVTEENDVVETVDEGIRADDGMVIGSETRRNYYRNLEVPQPFYDMIDGKRVFRSKEAQILWFRGNVTARQFAFSLLKKYEGDDVRIIETFERYFPDDHVDWYINVSLDSEGNSETVESISLDPIQDDSNKDDLKSLFMKQAKSNVESLKVESISVDDQETSTKPLPSSFGTDLPGWKSKPTDESSVSMIEVSSNDNLSSWSTPKKSTSGDIGVSVVEEETADLEIVMVDASTIRIDVDINEINSIENFIKQKTPTIQISLNNGDSVACEIPTKALSELMLKSIRPSLKR